MIDIQQALYNLLHSRYGRDVRMSLHDAVYQINDNANEALQKAKSMGVGTAVDSSTSSSEGYVEGNLYLNSNTWDLWQCVGENSWLNTGNVKGEKGDKGTDGINNFVYIRYSAYYDGTDFTATPTASSQFIGLYYGTSATAPTNKQDYQWTSYVGSAGTNAYVYVRYSEFSDGTNFVDAPTALTKYIGFYAGSSSSAPANKSSYVWSMYVGRDGEGSGDMREDIYAPNATEQGLVGTVDRALAAKTAETATDATNAENLKKSNGETLDVDTVSTKLQNLDENGKIDASNVKVGEDSDVSEELLSRFGGTAFNVAQLPSISANSSKAFNLTSSGHFMFIFFGSGTMCGIVPIRTTSGGKINAQTPPADIAFTTATNELTIQNKNTGNALASYVITFTGSISWS